MNSRGSDEYAAWRREVKKRDGRYCQWPECRKLGKEVHHIIKYASNMILRTSTSNGVFLCAAHHKRVKNKENDYALMFITIVEKNTKAYQERLKKRNDKG